MFYKDSNQGPLLTCLMRPIIHTSFNLTINFGYFFFTLCLHKYLAYNTVLISLLKEQILA